MALSSKLISALSSAEMSDLRHVKAELSAKFLRAAAPAAALGGLSAGKRAAREGAKSWPRSSNFWQ